MLVDQKIQTKSDLVQKLNLPEQTIAEMAALPEDFTSPKTTRPQLRLVTA